MKKQNRSLGDGESSELGLYGAVGASRVDDTLRHERGRIDFITGEELEVPAGGVRVVPAISIAVSPHNQQAPKPAGPVARFLKAESQW